MENRFGILGKYPRRLAGDSHSAEERHAASRYDCSRHLQQQRLAGASLAGEQCQHALRHKVRDRENDVRRFFILPAGNVCLVDGRQRLRSSPINTVRLCSTCCFGCLFSRRYSRLIIEPLRHFVPPAGVAAPPQRRA
jgi:hypothetical protein